MAPSMQNILEEFRSEWKLTDPSCGMIYDLLVAQSDLKSGATCKGCVLDHIDNAQNAKRHSAACKRVYSNPIGICPAGRSV